ncbi:MAG: cytochrome c3 family protein [Nitrospirota bacterium]
MAILAAGTISRHINGKLVFLILLQFVAIIAYLGYRSYMDSSAECITCHGDKSKLRSLGYPQFYVTQEMAEKESRHPNVKCHECHLGNGRAKDHDSAHKGMLKPLFVSDSGGLLERKMVSTLPMLPQGNDRIRELLPPNTNVRNILWHDRDPKTFNFDPKIAEKTCGKSNCHPQELEQFRKTIMGTNFRQRTMKTWLDPYGPHNCGPSFADTPPFSYLRDGVFDFKNTEEIVRNLNTGFSKDQAISKQKLCNICHAGCLDCHYAPDKEKGVHAFIKKPVSESCSGNGRGTSICHPGSMHSRRGETYIGGDYSIPTGMAPDVHYKKNIHCVDCHQAGEKGMGDMQRKAVCQDCHIEIEDAHKKSIHKNMDCATCHISELGGYQITVWGPGFAGDRPNPFKKYSLYYGIQKPPLLMKDQKGIWMPVKVWPHSVGNIKNDVKPSEKIMFRWPAGETRDAYYVIGTFDGLPGNNKHMLWLEIEQAAHPYGKSRTCESCHKTESQNSVSIWEFEDDQGAEPFKGGYRIVADKDGLRIEEMRNTTPIKPLNGARPEDFASWLFLKDKWKAPGDFSIKIDRDKYAKYLSMSGSIERYFKSAGEKSANFSKARLKQLKRLKGIAVHNPEPEEVKIASRAGGDR